MLAPQESPQDVCGVQPAPDPLAGRGEEGRGMPLCGMDASPFRAALRGPVWALRTDGKGAGAYKCVR